MYFTFNLILSAGKLSDLRKSSHIFSSACFYCYNWVNRAAFGCLITRKRDKHFCFNYSNIPVDNLPWTIFIGKKIKLDHAEYKQLSRKDGNVTRWSLEEIKSADLSSITIEKYF